MSKHAARRAFTLVEMLVVMAIIGILMAITLGVAGRASNDGAESKAKSQIAALQLEIDLFRADRGFFPSDTNGTLRTDFFEWFEDKYGDGNGVFDGQDRIYDTVDISRYRNNDGTVTLSDIILRDPWGSEYRYELINPFIYSVGSSGPDKQWGTEDDLSSREGSNL